MTTKTAPARHRREWHAAPEARFEFPAKSADVASSVLERWDKHFSVDLRAPLVLSRDFARQLPAATEGAIVNIIDQRVLRPTPRCSPIV